MPSMSKRLWKASNKAKAVFGDVNDTDQSESQSEELEGADSPDFDPPAKRTKLNSPKDSRKPAPKGKPACACAGRLSGFCYDDKLQPTRA